MATGQPSAPAPNTDVPNKNGLPQTLGMPSIGLPKGGGAIRGIGEKFAANPVTGTGSMSIPIVTSPGRSGFGPQLSLSYDSGAGNSPFGFGWSFSIPSITRKTDKGLPQYNDGEDSDVFILSGAEDLVPILVEDAQGHWGQEVLPPRQVNGVNYQIQRYRPRIEGLFARIERWTNADTGEIHWRSITKDNITTLYGRNNESRIFDPFDADPQHPTRIFSWLICQSYDAKGNAIVYEYQSEDSRRIYENPQGHTVTLSHEINRSEVSRSANRYLKRICYGNREPNRDLATGDATDPAELPGDTWMFEVVFDYDEGHLSRETTNGDEQSFVEASSDPTQDWTVRSDPYSSYRAGFEIRTYRLCQRVMVFHHIPDVSTDQKGYDGLVRSTDFTYSYEQDPASASNPIYSFLLAVTQNGYKDSGTSYLKRGLPPVEFEYTFPAVQNTIEVADAESIANLPIGLDGKTYQWIDLHGEGIPGILTEQAGVWFYKRNISPVSSQAVEFTPLETVAARPNFSIANEQSQFMDIDGDGLSDLVIWDGPMAGFYKHDNDEGWGLFQPFSQRLNRDTHDPNLKFVDLDGDGHTDVFITEDNAFIWHPSLAEAGFGAAQRIAQIKDEEKWPRLVFADGTQSIYLADLSGDGLTDLVRIRNGEVCYWPNLGYGRFGAKVTMDNAPWFDAPDQFDQKRIRLADIDGSGTTDIIYLRGDGVRLYFNQSGNGWSEAQILDFFPQVDDLVSIMPVDLLGNGTACLVWSSPLPGDTEKQLRFINLMGAQKPHLLVKMVNNLGSETRIEYAPSTRFYLLDKQSGNPWITHLPFPVHCVERIETYDAVSQNYFVTRYAYHQGYFDGVEREFRGFGMVEQWDTEAFTVLSSNIPYPDATNIDAMSHIPSSYSRSWFHTGIFVDRNTISRHMAHEYYSAPAQDGASFGIYLQTLLDDTVLPSDNLTGDETREACRSLKGALLRQEIYAQDGSLKESIPYSVSERNYAVEFVQPRSSNRHSVYFTHPLETITCHYERNVDDSRDQHEMVLKVDPYGNILKAVTVTYGRVPGKSPLQGADKVKQEQLLITYTENDVTNALSLADDYRTPLPCETRTYELTGFRPTPGTLRFNLNDFAANDFEPIKNLVEALYEQGSPPTLKRKRLIERTRILYRRDNLAGLLPLAQVQSRALPGESYKLAFTSGLISSVYQRKLNNQPAQILIPTPANVLGGQSGSRGGYVDLDQDGDWWIPAGRIFYHPDVAAPSQQELAEARQHFFMPKRFTDSFGQSSTVLYDSSVLLPIQTTDALNNSVESLNDYRTLQPRLITDPNRNRTEAAFDALGMVVGTAIMGKVGENLGDSLAGFQTDLTRTEIDQFFAAPQGAKAATLLGSASTRIIYDVTRYWREPDLHKKQPIFAATLARETHASDPIPADGLKIQVSFSYSDGFSREIQKKIQAESGPLIEGSTSVNPRWVGSGSTIFNNKGKPVRQYEPFFDNTHDYRFGQTVGVSSTLFYDPVERVVATLHPNHTWEKVVFDSWQQQTFDVNDTVLQSDPKTDQDAGAFFKALPDADYLPGWHDSRINGQLGSDEQTAATKAGDHANTPTTVHFDALGRTFLTIADNGSDGSYTTRVELDIEGNQRQITDAQGRAVMRYDYDMLGNRIHQASMEAGERWILNDTAGKALFAWDSRNQRFRTAYDELRRPIESYLQDDTGFELLAGRTIYGETQTNPEFKNQRGKAIQVFDQAGVVTSDDYDFKGNLLNSSRQLAAEYKKTLNWAAPAMPAFEAPVYTSSTTYDGLNRPIQLIAPHSDATSTKRNVIQPAYNEANLLESVHVWLDYPNEPTHLLDAAAELPSPVGVDNLDYDAKGQRTLIEYSNGVQTTYLYDDLTYRLIHLQTTRNTTGLLSRVARFLQPQAANATDILQDLSYTYDPVGNITHIQDDAQQTIFFRNRRVEPSADYTYDAIYRLTQATGREHLGQTNGQPNAPTPPDALDNFHSRLDQPNVDNAMGTYIENYVYDMVGNILSMQHRGSDPSHPGWTRTYTYAERSLIEPAKISNRLSRTTIGTIVEMYRYDGSAGVHGDITSMPHLSLMQWDYRDQLQATAQQVVNNGGTPETTWYVYDSSGQRIRKVTERQTAAGQTPTRRKERIYLGGFEIYREYGSDGSTPSLERETLHVMDDKQRVALVETRTRGSDSSSKQLIRYELGNHLGSVSLELDAQAQIITYEEYYPYGGTAYQAVSNQTETPKRYRYTGKERDEENGFYYHGARYYAPWLGRWVSCDPLSLKDGINVYAGVTGNPISKVDSSGTESNWWDDTIKGVESARGWVKGTAQKIGNQVVDNAEEDIASLGIKNSFVKETIRTVAALEATVAATAFEVAADVVMIGPNALAGLDSAGKNIGIGAARVAEAKNSEEAWLGVAQVAGGVGEAALVTVGILSLGEGAAIRPGANTVPGMTRAQVNRAIREQFTRFEGQVTQDSTSVLTRTAEQVTIEPFTGPVTPGGQLPPTAREVVIDTVQRQRLTGKVNLLDAKSSPTATLTPNQTVGYPLLEQFGGVVRGQAGGTVLPAGTIVSPTGVQIVRPAALIAKKALQAEVALTTDAVLERK